MYVIVYVNISRDFRGGGRSATTYSDHSLSFTSIYAGGFGEGCLSVDLSIGKQNIDAMFSLPRV